MRGGAPQGHDGLLGKRIERCAYPKRPGHTRFHASTPTDDYSAHLRDAGKTATFRRAAATAAQFRTLKDVRFIGVLSE
jgi:hypothetical protein